MITRCAHGIPWESGCVLCGRNMTLGPTYTVTQPNYTDLLLLIAECLVVLAWKAEPDDAGARQSRLYALRAALARVKETDHD